MNPSESLSDKQGHEAGGQFALGQIAPIDLSVLGKDVENLRSRYRSAQPFPHIVLDDFLAPAIAALAMNEFPELDPAKWNNYIHTNERKFSNTDPRTWGPNLRSVLEELNSPRFVRFLGEITGIDGLLADDTLEGGGLHQSPMGGFLNIHADYTVHPRQRHWRRRVNLIVYLNTDWPSEYGGDLELWSTDMKRCEQKIAPVANRAVIFSTDADSFHGHPEPLRCPPDMTRRSLALYYFTYEDKPFARSTEYRARPGDGVRGLLIYLDKQLLRSYDWAKRRTGISDESISHVVRRLERLRSFGRK